MHLALLHTIAHFCTLLHTLAICTLCTFLSFFALYFITFCTFWHICTFLHHFALFCTSALYVLFSSEGSWGSNGVTHHLDTPFQVTQHQFGHMLKLGDVQFSCPFRVIQYQKCYKAALPCTFRLFAL